MKFISDIITTNKSTCLSGVPKTFAPYVLSQIAKKAYKKQKTLLHIAIDDVSLDEIIEAMSFFAPALEIIKIPAWDTVPYDRVSPKSDIIGQRIEAFSTLANKTKIEKPRLVITTISSILQRVPKKRFFENASFEIKKGQEVNVDKLYQFLIKNGYNNTGQVMEQGEYAIRGGIVDIFPSGAEKPLRLDFFGDELETIKSFDPITQRTQEEIDSFVFRLMSEISLDDVSVSRFRSNYRELFGNVKDDPLYESISSKRRFSGMEHWLPLFHEEMDTIFSYLPNLVVSYDYQCELAKDSRYNQILDYFNARKEVLETQDSLNKLSVESSTTYRPIQPEMLYLSPLEWEKNIKLNPSIELYPFVSIEEEKENIKNVGAKEVADFSDVRARPNLSLYEELKKRILSYIKQDKKVLLCFNSKGNASRVCDLLKEQAVENLKKVESLKAFKKLEQHIVGYAILQMKTGFETKDYVVLTQEDILGDKLNRRTKTKKQSENFIEDISALNQGDIVVHSEHGIGRYEGLINIKVGNAPHDCLCIIYADDAKLFVPVENIEVLSKYGTQSENVVLDRLGGVAWQARKSKLKKRIRDMADALIKLAAERKLKRADKLSPPDGTYDEFVSFFPYVETKDQDQAIKDVIEDLSKNTPMDRLVCGDVGFGKTEVALRAAFVAAASGMQVALVVPTTLLARQHYQTFVERLKAFSIKTAMLSRMVTPTNAKKIKKQIKDGEIEIVIGTHALLAKNMEFCNLGLLIIDEEQHFGVAHKEKLKQLKSDVHVLTLTATPIPRTLQLSLTGVRELSLITTPPVDRLAVRTFVLPFDEVVVKEAILRERYRGGQVFYVCPRVSDIREVSEKLKIIVPDAKIAVAHGQMSPKQLEEVMNAFSAGEYDILLSTTIIESGIDMPTVNTMIVHRSDMFGLSQLYQLRGRIGRGKVRAYAYLTIPPRKKITKTAEKRLRVMQALDSLGAGFSLASHDLDIRGAGNLLGEEQSGHIKEVGVGLYQHMLEEAIANAKAGGDYDNLEDESFSPQISTASPILIPENYIKDLNVRLSIYRKIASIDSLDGIEDMKTELIDRFGEIPKEVNNLLEVIEIKHFCKIANIEKIDAGHKGAVITLKNNKFPNPAGLIEYINQKLGLAKVRPDHKIVITQEWITASERIKGVKSIAKKLSQIATKE